MEQRETTANEPRFAAQGSTGDRERRLLDEREEVIREISSQALNGNGSHPQLQDTDHALANELRDLEYSRRESLSRRLQQLDEALARLHSGLYGKCSECGSAIAEKRLAADPAVTMCLGCKELSEPAGAGRLLKSL